MSIFGKGKRNLFSLLLVGFFLFAQVFGFLLPAVAVKAQEFDNFIDWDAINVGSNMADTIDAAASAPKPTPLQVNVVGDVPRSLMTAKEKIQDSITGVLLGSLLSGTSYFLNKLAYDSATYLASKAAGQTPLVFQEGFGDYITTVGKDSVATAVEELGQDVGKAFGDNSGFHFCQPSNPFILPSIMMGIKNLYPQFGSKTGPSPKCTWSQLSKKIGGLTSGETFENFGTDVISQQMATGLRVNQSDFGLALDYFKWVDEKVNNSQNAAELERLEGQGFKSLTDKVSGYIKTPAQIFREESTALTGKHQGELTTNQIAGVYGANNWGMLINAGTIFLSTFASNLMTNIFDKGILPDPTLVANQSESITNEYSSLINVNRTAAEAAFNFLFTTVPEKKQNAYNLIVEYASCPSSPGINNCVMDDGLKRALERTALEPPMTIQQAIDKKLLHGDWFFYPPSREIDNTDVANCFLKGYCYSNLQKLRKARILPLGFEIAALKADPDHLNNWTLDKVVKGYETCGPNGKGGPQYPYCHLIDPNWVLRVPEYHCESQVIGSSLLIRDQENRKSECVDISSCILEDQNGNCLGDNFGYCLKEKNTWNIKGETCPAEFNSCRTFVNTTDNNVVSYLARTLDYGECNQEAIGCKAYSLSKNNDTWVNTAQVDLSLKKVGQSQVIYFNRNIEQDNNCPANSDGCHGFFEQKDGLKSAETLALRKAPDYLGCYDMAPATKEVIDWPQTTFDIDKLTAEQPKECNNFSQVCLPEENGCKKYTNTEGNPEFVGIMGNNSCPEICVGYSTFKQEGKKKDSPHPFEPDKFPLYFIPTDAKECPSVYEGCSEYTNLEAAAVGGEKTEYYTGIKYCEKPSPDGTNLKTYYSWEGSATTGYVIKIHKLLPIVQEEFNYINGNEFTFNAGDTKASVFAVGTPMYADDNQASLQQNYNLCNKTNYNNLINVPDSFDKADDDCHALYDDKGNVYYSLLGQTIAVSAQCHPLRKTESSLYTDSSIVTTEMCSRKLGLWGDDPTDAAETNVCRRCYDGGQYRNGACVYMAITGDNESPSCQGPNNNPGLYNGCRAYTGHAANTVQDVLETVIFEPGANNPEAIAIAKNGWSAGEIKSESGQLGQNSLLVDETQLTYTFATGTLQKGEWYELNFWVKGTPQNLKIYLSEGAGNENKGNFTGDPIDPAKTDADILVPVNQDWKQYHLGPVQFTGNGNDDANPSNLKFVRTVIGNQGPYFLDNVRVTRISDKLFRIKDSWKEKNGGLSAPSSCLNDPGEPVPAEGMPGKYLGCQKYSEIDGTNSTNVYATNFDKLCRPQAEGCTAMYDSYNTMTEEKAVAFNIWCSAKIGTIKDGKCVSTLFGSCNVPVNGDGCFIKKAVLTDVGQLPSEAIVKSTVIIPADTPLDTPIYLTKKPEYQCNKSNIGCEKLALQEQVLPDDNNTVSYHFSETTGLKNDPDKYEQTLCSDDNLGCSEFKNGNEIMYFKDPKLTGNKLCAYNLNLELSNGTKLSGWFKNGVGKCSQDKNQLCGNSSDCGEGNTCDDTGTVPCYDNYYQAGGKYGIWSNKSDQYNGFVGICEDKYDQCVELIDPADSSGSGAAGKAYYIKLTQDLKSKSAEACKGKASLKEGCVLLDRTDNPNKIYNSGATYDLSAASNPKYNLVTPSTVTTAKNPKLDANEIVKVEKSRTCSEWLACRDQMKVTGADGQVRNVCTQYKSCSATEPGVACTSWTGLTNIETDKFTEKNYINRDTSWYGNDYSGYTLFNQYQINSVLSVSFDDDIVSYLAHEADPIIFNNNPQKSCDSKIDWSVCGFDDGGRCYLDKCIYPLSGIFPAGKANNGASARQYLERGSCKSYPEQNSPYPQAIGGNFNVIKAAYTAPDGTQTERKDFKGKQNGYAQSNICQDGDCSCEYKKISYKGAVFADYWSLDKDINNIGGVCSSGDKVGSICRTDADCSHITGSGITINGICGRVDNISTHIGLRGFCVERDFSRPLNKKTGEFACLTWVPIDTAASRLDQYNNDPKAGYYPAEDATVKQPDGSDRTFGQVYCANATANSMGAVKTDSYGDILRRNKGDLLFPGVVSDDSRFKANDIVYSKLFNAYGDYIYDTKTMVTSTFESSKCNVPNSFIAKSCAFEKISFEQKYMNISGLNNAQTMAPNLKDPFNVLDDLYKKCSISTPNNGANCLLMQSWDGDNSQNGYDYKNRLYTMLQHWAWHGGMYQSGLRSREDIIGNGITVPIIDQDLLDSVIKNNCVNKLSTKYKIMPSGEWAPTNIYDCSSKEGEGKDIIENYYDAIFNASGSPITGQLEDLLSTSSTEITNPDAVVLFASPLYYRNYLQTTDLTAVFDGYVTSTGYQISDGTKNVEPFKTYDLPIAVKYKLVPTSVAGFYSFGALNSDYISQHPAGSYQFVADSAFYQRLKLYNTQIKKMHFGPMIHATVAGGKKESTSDTMISIDFDKLNGKVPVEKKTEDGIASYDLTYSVDDVNKGLYTFKIKMKPNNDTKYIAVRFFPTLEETNTKVSGDLSDFFKELWDIFGKNADISSIQLGDYLANWKKVAEWKYGGGARTATVIWVDFDQYGKMKEAPNNENQFRYHYMSTHDFDDKADYLWEKFPSLLLPTTYLLKNKNNPNSGTAESIKAADKGVTPFLAVVAEIKPSCTDYQLVYKDDKDFSKQTNKAWTDRVWNYGQNNTKGYFQLKFGAIDSLGGKFLKSNPWQPFGSVPLSGQNLTSSDATDGANWWDARRRFAFTDPSVDGLYYGCSAPALEGLAPNFQETLIGQDKNYAKDWPINRCSRSSDFYGQIIAKDISYSIPSGEDYLKNLFISSLSRLYNQNQNTVWNQDILASGYDYSGDETMGAGLIPPQVYSVNPANCFGLKETGKNCTIGEANQLTVNRRNFTVKDYDGDNHIDEDQDGDGKPDSIIAKGYYNAVANFFAFADKNRMPIRQVKVDWDDGIIVNDDRFGKYKNKKPYCMDNNDPSASGAIGECSNNPQLTCQKTEDCPDGGSCTVGSAAKNFGNAPRACEQSFFEFIHGYSCSQSDIILEKKYVVKYADLSQAEKDALAKSGFTDKNTPKVCAFTPKVQVTDNWGWCNGDCEGAGLGCSSNKKTPTGGEDNQCDANPKAWTPFNKNYNARIIVVPS